MEITILPFSQVDSIEILSVKYTILDTYKKSPHKPQVIEKESNIQPDNNLITQKQPLSRPLWLPNSASSQCMYPGCVTTFNLFSFFSRRHHCRCCGKLYCSEHSKYKIKLPTLGYKTPVRVCKICYENVYLYY